MINILQHHTPKYVDSSPDMLTLLNSIRQVTGSFPGRHVAYPNWHSSWFAWASTGKLRKLPSIRPRPLPGTQFSVYYSPVVLTLQATKPRGLDRH